MPHPRTIIPVAATRASHIVAGFQTSLILNDCGMGLACKAGKGSWDVLYLYTDDQWLRVRCEQIESELTLLGCIEGKAWEDTCKATYVIDTRII